MANFGGMMAMQPPALVVADKYVYVVFAGTLFQYSVEGLQLVASAPLMPRGQGGQGGGRGGRGGRGGGAGGAGAGAAGGPLAPQPPQPPAGG